MGWPGPLTHRQFETWTAWLDGEQHNWPSLSDQYAMRIAQRVQQVLMEHPNEVTLNHQVVTPDDLVRNSGQEQEVESDEDMDETMTPEEAAEQTRYWKAVWGARLGVKIPE